VTVKCSGPNGTTVLNDKVVEGGQCKLDCEQEGLKVVDAYETLSCKEKDGHLNFTRKNDSEPIVRETLKNLDLCPGRAPAIYIDMRDTALQ
jgi:hypothetical protein